MTPDSLVLGAAGFIGRSLVLELLGSGHTVLAAVRGKESWLANHLEAKGADLGRLTIVRCDITEPGLGLPEGTPLSDVRDVYNSAATMAFGLAAEDARRVNVAGALNVLDWSARLPALRRLVHITGYRVTVKDSAEARYENGAYGASKFEADAALWGRARELRVPLTVANPSSVIGPGQYFGLVDLVSQLWQGKLPALPGRRDTFVPVVDIGYFARFLASLPGHADTAGNSYTVLDDTTPNLPELVGMLASHIGVRPPRFSLPTGLIRRLPRALTGADPEGLEFVASDRYDTTAAEAHAKSAGLSMPPVDRVLRDWADHLVATRFGAAPPTEPSGFCGGTWVVGEREHPDYVLLHGLPVDSDVWDGVRARLGAATLSADLPGLGRSAPTPTPLADWLAELLAPVRTQPVLVAHSLACGPAIDYAIAQPERIRGLVLVSPFFLQARAGMLARSSLAAPLLRRASATRLAAMLGVPEGPAIASAAANLRRPGVARRTVTALRSASSPRLRATLRERLAHVTVPVDIIIGAADPLVVATDRRVTVVPGTGHYPQLTHPEAITTAAMGR